MRIKDEEWSLKWGIMEDLSPARFSPGSERRDGQQFRVENRKGQVGV